jgi:hypothetical protein
VTLVVEGRDRPHHGTPPIMQLQQLQAERVVEVPQAGRFSRESCSGSSGVAGAPQGLIVRDGRHTCMGRRGLAQHLGDARVNDLDREVVHFYRRHSVPSSPR